MTSKPHLVLFTKKGCPPCAETKKFLFDLYKDDLETTQYPFSDLLTVLDKHKQPSLVDVYDVHAYPTLLRLNKDGEELERIIGGKAVRAALPDLLLDLRILLETSK